MTEAPSAAIQTFTGRRIDPFDPDPEQIVIEDIAQALGNQCRFGGHCRRFYSVAHHSCLLADLIAAGGRCCTTRARPISSTSRTR